MNLLILAVQFHGFWQKYTVIWPSIQYISILIISQSSLLTFCIFLFPVPLPGNHRSSFWNYNFAFSTISYKWNHTVVKVLCLTTFLIILLLRFTHQATYISSLFLFISQLYSIIWNIQLIYLFISWWAFELFPVWDTYSFLTVSFK